MRQILLLVVMACFATPTFAYDFDGDGKHDILWQDRSTGTVAVWLMNGGTVHRAAFLGGVPSEWAIALVGDTNGDGMDDVIWRHTNGTVAVWLMNGITITAVLFPGSAASEWEIQR